MQTQKTNMATAMNAEAANPSSICIFQIGEPNYGIQPDQPKNQTLRIINEAKTNSSVLDILYLTPDDYINLLLEQNLQTLETLVTQHKSVSTAIQAALNHCSDILEFDIPEQCLHAQTKMHEAYETAKTILKNPDKTIYAQAGFAVTETMLMAYFIRSRMEGQNFQNSICVTNEHLKAQLEKYRNGKVTDTDYLLRTMKLAVTQADRRMKNIQSTTANKANRQAMLDKLSYAKQAMTNLL